MGVAELQQCKLCRHWRKIRDDDYVDDDGTVWPGPHGECNAVNDYSINKNSIAWISGDGEDMSLITREVFSCILFKAIDNNGVGREQTATGTD